MTWERVLMALLVLALGVHLVQLRRRHREERERDRMLRRVVKYLDVWAESWGQPADVVAQKLQRAGRCTRESRCP